jgi:hypothetical protein
MNGIKGWPVWIFCVSALALWGIPHVPYFHVDLPYIFELGGSALVVLYLGVGFFSLGLYLTIIERLKTPVRTVTPHAVLIGGGAFMLAGGCFWLYLTLLRMSVALS